MYGAYIAGQIGNSTSAVVIGFLLIKPLTDMYKIGSIAEAKEHVTRSAIIINSPNAELGLPSIKMEQRSQDSYAGNFTAAQINAVKSPLLCRWRMASGLTSHNTADKVSDPRL